MRATSGGARRQGSAVDGAGVRGSARDEVDAGRGREDGADPATAGALAAPSSAMDAAKSRLEGLTPSERRERIIRYAACTRVPGCQTCFQPCSPFSSLDFDLVGMQSPEEEHDGGLGGGAPVAQPLLPARHLSRLHARVRECCSWFLFLSLFCHLSRLLCIRCAAADIPRPVHLHAAPTPPHCLSAPSIHADCRPPTLVTSPPPLAGKRWPSARRLSAARASVLDTLHSLSRLLCGLAAVGGSVYLWRARFGQARGAEVVWGARRCREIVVMSRSVRASWPTRSPRAYGVILRDDATHRRACKA